MCFSLAFDVVNCENLGHFIVDPVGTSEIKEVTKKPKEEAANDEDRKSVV